MFKYVLGIAVCLLMLKGCQQSSPVPPTLPGPTAAAAPAAGGTLGATGGASVAAAQAASGERPFKATVTWTAAPPQWAGDPTNPEYAPSLFGGRCSVPSDYVISATFAGNATHAGRVTGSGSHCSQIQWSSQGPLGATYSDGQGVINSANGSTILLRYGKGSTGADPATGELWFKDEWTIIGGTGLFTGATGSGVEGGRFASFDAILAGAPVAMRMEGTITYDPSGRK